MNKFFFEFTLQSQLEKAEYLLWKFASEEKPFEFKYEARELLKTLLSSEILNKEYENDSEIYNYTIASKAIINFKIAIISLECEENQESLQYGSKALQLFSSLKQDILINYLNFVQELYNYIGFIHLGYSEKDQILKGLAIIEKSAKLYHYIISTEQYKTNHSVTNNFKEYCQQNNYQKNFKFQYYYQGGLSQKQTDNLFTLTYFYLAQGYTKIEYKEQAANYCGKTMQIQLSSQTYNLKDWCVNCINLSEYYINSKQFSQALYILNCGYSLLPEQKKKKLRATYNLSFARYYLELLKFNVILIQNYESEDLKTNTETIEEDINKKKLKFEEMKIKFAEIHLKLTYDQVKELFQLANTQYKKALEVFILDGYVTEHITILTEQSELYKYLCYLEPDFKRCFAMHQRRIDMLEPVYKQINPKAFQAFYQKLQVEIAEVYLVQFDILSDEIASMEKVKTAKIKQLNKIGLKTISNYQELFDYITNDKEITKDSAYYQSVINSKFNQAKVYSKLAFSVKSERIETQKNSLKCYQFIIDYITSNMQSMGNLTSQMNDQLNMCKEMVAMIPSKIDKIHAGLL